MPAQTEQKTAITQEHSHNKHYAAIIVSTGTALVLLMIVIMLLYKHPSTSVPVPTSSQISQSQQQTASLQQKMQEVTPAPITSKKDLNTALQELNTTNTSQIDTGLNQNAQDTAGFSQ